MWCSLKNTKHNNRQINIKQFLCQRGAVGRPNDTDTILKTTDMHSYVGRLN